MNINFTALTKQADAIYQSTQKIIDDLEPNQRKTTKDIVESVVAETGAKASIVSGYVSMYLAHSNEVKGRSGAFGGWFKLNTPSTNALRTNTNSNADQEEEIGL